MSTLLEGLNPQQRSAVEHTQGPLLVIAGAGSGKTRVITTRIMHLVEQGISPYQILAVTFTNKAAMEMRHRISISLNQNMRDLTICTFHAFCARFLRREIGYLERNSSFVIFDTQDQTSCLKRVIRNLDLNEKNYPAAHFRNKFSYIKNKGDLEPSFDTDLEQNIFEGYQKEMLAQNALDFDDLLLLSCKILQEFPDCRDRYRNRFQHIMVDEYQDTNKIQARLINLLLNEDRNLCVVGDEDQSIYGWRGADIENILHFEMHYPGAQIFKLEQNYRSSQNILDYANRVISKNEMRKAKELWTESGAGKPIIIRDEMSGRSEAEFIVQTIMSLRNREKCDYSEFAILFRSNFLSRSLEDMCRRYRVPFQLIGGLKFYDRKEIKDLLAYMRMVVNPRDWTSFVRAAGVPTRGLGAKSLDKLYYLFNEGHDLLTTFNKAIDGKVLSGKGFKGLKELRELYIKLKEMAENTKPQEWLNHLIEELDYRRYLEKIDEVGVEDRVANIDELLAGMGEMENQGITTLAQFMDFSALVSDQDDYAEDAPKVSLMTVHAAKGLEFDTVFVMGLEDGVFPNQRSISENLNAIEEERRLFYVAVTRARKQLYLTYARRRMTFGSITSNMKSRFLAAPGAEEEEWEDEYDRGNDSFLDYKSRQRTKPKAKLNDLRTQVNRMKEQLQELDVDVDFGELEGGDKPAKAPAIKTGDVVRHKKFGTGTVMSKRGKGDMASVTVYFPGVGKKTLVAKFAKLEKVFN